MARAWWVLPLGLAASTGCLDALESPHELTDLRVLAVIAEPPEIMFSQALDPTTLEPVFTPEGIPVMLPNAPEVVFTPLVVNPRGLPLTYHWEFCPVQSTLACLDYEELRDAAPTEAHAVLDAMHDQVADGEVGFVPDATRGITPHAVPSFTVPVGLELLFFHLQSNGLGGGLGAWPSVVLVVESGGQSLRVVKRFVLSLETDTLRRLSELARSELGEELSDTYGITYCPPGVDPETLDCLPLKARAPNRNPVITSVEYSAGPSSDTTWTPVVNGRLALPLRATDLALREQNLRLRPVFDVDADDDYQILKADLQTREIFLQDIVEDPSISWYASAGSLADNLTWPKFSKSIDTIYTLPLESGTGVETVFLVARDQRGGMTWVAVEMDVAVQ